MTEADLLALLIAASHDLGNALVPAQVHLDHTDDPRAKKALAGVERALAVHALLTRALGWSDSSGAAMVVVPDAARWAVADHDVVHLDVPERFRHVTLPHAEAARLHAELGLALAEMGAALSRPEVKP